MAEILLVYPPYGALERPALGLSLLKAGLTRSDLDCEIYYATFDFAGMIGLNQYGDISWIKNEMIGEWTFAGAAFPDFEPDHGTYLEQVCDAFSSRNEPEKRKKIKDLFLSVRSKATGFIDRTAKKIVDSSPRIVGISTSFSQNTAALALARKIKELDPSIVTVLGGSNCEGEMGWTMVNTFPWIDFAVSGEADEIFPVLCKTILSDGVVAAGESPSPGIFVNPAIHRQPALLEQSQISRASVTDLENLPIPDYDDYFRELNQFPGREQIIPGLVVETSRGCWWGARSHCTFCGLNGDSLAFRSKSPQRATGEFQALAEKYGISRFMVTDNILDRNYYSTTLPALARLPESYTLFYEIKANASYSQLQSLKDAGVLWVQPGIESLHDESLKLMRKGVRARTNVQLLKWSRELGLCISWNILCGFPGEKDEWFGETSEWIPLIEHLQPATEIRPIRFDRFSPYHQSPEQYGLQLKPTWPVSYIYPVDEATQAGLSYRFETREGTPSHTNTLRVSNMSDRSLGGPGRDRLQARIRSWHANFLSTTPAILSMTQQMDGTRITDTRSCAPEVSVFLTGALHRIHRVCHGFSSLDEIGARVAGDGGSPLTREEIQQALDQLVERKLLLCMDHRWMALAIEGEIPRIPRNHREGYPGGWVLRSTKNGNGTKDSAKASDTPVTPPVHSSRVRFSEPLVLESSRTIADYEIVYETHGTLSPARDNVILVLHPLTKNHHVAGRSGDESKPGWWDGMVGPGKALDSNRYFIICSNVIGGEQSTGPASVDPHTGKPFGLRFPILTIPDMVQAQERLIQHLGIHRLFAVVGGCFGGLQALEWSIRYPNLVENAVVIGATPSTSAHTIAIFSVMRRLIQNDPAWQNGDYYNQSFPFDGLANALVAAVPLWMSRETMEQKFGRRRNSSNGFGFSLEPEFDVELYLEKIAAGVKKNMDPNALLYLTRAQEYFDIEKSYGSLDGAFGRIQAKVLLISYRSDWRYPPAEMEEMNQVMQRNGVVSHHVELDSPLGHGAFIYDPLECGNEIQRFLGGDSPPVEDSRLQNLKATP